MKARTGFVANSSSSSFLLWGVERSEFRDKLDNEDLDLYDEADKRNLRIDSDAGVVGAAVFFDDWGIMSNEELQEAIAHAKELMVEAGFSEAECKFYYGVQY